MMQVCNKSQKQEHIGKTRIGIRIVLVFTIVSSLLFSSITLSFFMMKVYAQDSPDNKINMDNGISKVESGNTLNKEKSAKTSNGGVAYINPQTTIQSKYTKRYQECEIHQTKRK